MTVLSFNTGLSITSHDDHKIWFGQILYRVGLVFYDHRLLVQMASFPPGTGRGEKCLGMMLCKYKWSPCMKDLIVHSESLDFPINLVKKILLVQVKCVEMQDHIFPQE